MAKLRTYDELPTVSFNEAVFRADAYRAEGNKEMAAVWEYLAILTQKVDSVTRTANAVDDRTFGQIVLGGQRG
jgi:hypothetical protein